MDFMESKCASCGNNDWETMREIRAVYRERGVALPEHTWCKITDQPEDVRWETCAYLEE